MRKLKLILKVLPLDDKIIGLALNDDSFSDFEDGLQCFTAIEDEQESIITRNLKDYKKSKLPTMTANQFIKTIKPCIFQKGINNVYWGNCNIHKKWQ